MIFQSIIFVFVHEENQVILAVDCRSRETCYNPSITIRLLLLQIVARVVTWLCLVLAKLLISQKMPSPDAIVIVHAGVGRRSELSAREVSELCERAAHGGRLVGCATGDPTAAVVEAIRILEESPYTNAGTGQLFKYDGNSSITDYPQVA